MRASDAMLERLERVIETLQDNSVKMGQMLAVHNEKDNTRKGNKSR